MKNPRRISELLSESGTLGNLQARLRERSSLLDLVRAALTPDLAAAVHSAGIEAGQLNLGVASAAWAARMRYECDALKLRLSESLPGEIVNVRVRVVHSML